MKRVSIFRLLGTVTAVLLLAGCGGQVTWSRLGTLSATVAIEVSPGTVVPRPATLDSPEEAQELVSFPVLVPDPDTLPAGLELEGIGWQPHPEKDTELVALSYRDAEYEMDLYIQQIALGEKGMGAPRQPHEEVSVRGTTGYLLSSEHAEGQGPVALAWEENGQAVTVSASGLTLEQTLRIAAGLKPVGK